MALTKVATLFISAAALVIAPAPLPDMPHAPFGTDKAFAKNGNGNGGGNANGNSGGNGNGGGNGSGGGNSNAGGNSGNSGNASSASNGNGNTKSRSVSSRGNSSGSKGKTGPGNGKGLSGFLNAVFGGQNAKNNAVKANGTSVTASQTSPRQVSGNKTRQNTKASYRLPKAERATLASVSIAPPVSPQLKEKNFRAKLGRLNSLNRNINAYLKSNDPHLAAVTGFITASIEFETASNRISELEQAVDAARTAFFAGVEDLSPFDAFAYGDITLEEAEARLSELEAIDPATLSEAQSIALTAEIAALTAAIDAEDLAQLSDLQSYDAYSYEDPTIVSLQDRLTDLGTVDTSDFTEEELAAFNAERAALEQALSGDTYTALTEAEQALFEQLTELGALEDATSDEALRAALEAMANENRLAEYGAEYVDEDVLEWAKQVLGVGEYTGKIDEFREISKGSVSQSSEGEGIPDLVGPGTDSADAGPNSPDSDDFRLEPVDNS